MAKVIVKESVLSSCHTVLVKNYASPVNGYFSKKKYNFPFYSFHVGSGCEEANAFGVAIQQARDVFDKGLQLGFDMKLLDIGGGFPGQDSAPVSFIEVRLYCNLFGPPTKNL